MKSSVKNINLASVDNLFSTKESRDDEKWEKIIGILLTELFPFKVIDNETMFDTAENVKRYGVLVSDIERLCDENGDELVAGHQRKEPGWVTLNGTCFIRTWSNNIRVKKYSESVMIRILGINSFHYIMWYWRSCWCYPIVSTRIS